MCTLSNTSSSAECGVWKYETTTENRNQNSLQVYASQKAKSKVQLWTLFFLIFCYKNNSLNNKRNTCDFTW